MRWYVVFFALICILIVTASICVDPSFISLFEENAQVSAGISAGEKRFPEIVLETPQARDSETASKPACKGFAEESESIAESNKEVAEEDETEEIEDTIFLRGGEYTEELVKGFPSEVIRAVDRKMSASQGEKKDILLFATSGGMAPLKDPLKERELAYVFSEIVRSYMRSLSVGAELTEVRFAAEEGRLRVEMRVNVSVDALGKKCLSAGLPPTAVFRLYGDLLLKNSEISVNSEDFLLECETYRIAQPLLLFACNCVLHVDDPQKAIAEVIKNVFVNAGIYR